MIKREFESLLREAANALGLSADKKVSTVNIGHRVDNLRNSFFTASGAGENTLESVANQIKWLTEILDDSEVREEWIRLFHEEMSKPGNEKGLNACQDWPLRRIAYDTVQKRRRDQP